MGRLDPTAKLLVALWLAVGLPVIAFHAVAVGQERVGRHMLRVEPAPAEDAYPAIAGVRRRQGSLEQVVAGEPRPALGDRVLRVGSADARGADQLRFDALAFAQTGDDLRVALTLERDGAAFSTWVEALRWPYPWREFPLAITLAVTCLAVLLRAGSLRCVRWLSAGSLCLCMGQLGGQVGNQLAAGPTWLFHAQIGFDQLIVLSQPVLLIGFLLFPEDRAPGERWILALPWLLLAQGIFEVGARVSATSEHLAGRARGGTFAIAQLAWASALAWNYARAQPVARRRIQWVFYGVLVGTLPTAGSNLLGAFGENLSDWAYAAARVAGTAAPLGFLVAVLRFDLFDIDRLISSTAAYALVGAAVLVALVAGLPAAADAAAAQLDVDAGGARLALAAGAVLLALPVARALRPQLERVLFAERHRIDRGMAAVAQALPGFREPRALIEGAGERLAEAMRPESLVAFARSGETFTPIFVRGRGGPPALETRGALVAALEAHGAPLAMDRFVARAKGARLGPFERAVLEALEAAVVLPVRHPAAGLVAIVALGPKRSGDVYTSTDLTLLSGFAAQLSTELVRFEQEALAREATALREGLRAYVPGAVQQQLAQGGEATAGQREVTVLFVDIRGYTAFAEARAADEVFSAVNAYTGAVSEIVARRRGSVVEFNGDGMMAVFGAPEALAAKERAAVEAAVEIAEAVAALPVRGPAGEPLSVGVGIATGPAFVGSVRAADRAIWTALGNTTNLAARLQGLTRELGAAVVIDAATRAAAGPLARLFERREAVAIRGRSEPQDVFALSLAADARA